MKVPWRCSVHVVGVSRYEHEIVFGGGATGPQGSGINDFMIF